MSKRPERQGRKQQRRPCWFKELLCYNTELLEMSVFLLYDISQLLRKLVETVPVVTLVAEKPAYKHGDTVNLTGSVNLLGVPQANITVALKMIDASDVETDLGNATTDGEGNYSLKVPIPVDMSSGAVTVTASTLSTTVTATFTRSKD